MTEESRRRSRAVPFRVVGLGLGALALVAIAFAVYAYARLLGYRRVAAHHLPEGTVAAFRVDVEQAVLYDPVRQHLVPLIDALGQSGAGRVERLRTRGSINLGIELREIVVGLGAEPDDWVVVLGGLFDRRVLDELERVLREEGTSVTHAGDALRIGDRLVVARAADGAVVFARSLDQVRRSLADQATFARLGLPDIGPGGFAFAARAFTAYPPLRPAGLERLARATRAVGVLVLSPQVRLEVRVDFQGTDGRAEALAFAADAQRLSSWVHAPERISVDATSVNAVVPMDIASLDRAGSGIAALASRWPASR